MDENLLTSFALGVFCFTFFSQKVLAVFQQCGYKTDEFFKALFLGKKVEIRRLSIYSLIFLFYIVLVSLIFHKFKTTYLLLILIGGVVLSGAFYLSSLIVKRADFTRRFIRIFLSSSLFAGLFSFLAYRLIDSLGGGISFAFAPLALLPILSPIFIIFGMLINLPYDKVRYLLSKRICKKKISKYPNLIKIGITGSYGKTSVKEYLVKMLSTKYNVLYTPNSYNTPLGICKSVKGDLSSYDILVTEMGARRKNDIKELCKMVCPDVGIITGISNQHGQTLGGEEGVKIAKNQLIEGLSGKGFAVFSCKSSGAKELFEKAKCKKYCVLNGVSDCVLAQNITQTVDGISFDLILKNQRYKTFAPLLGEHNVENILVATAVSLNLGVPIQKILPVIPTLAPPPHRAQIIKTSHGVTVIDDGYNANLRGIESTVNSIKHFSAYKIAIVSGIVESGKEDYITNLKVGEILAKTFDKIIAVGVNGKAIKDGAESLGKSVVLSQTTKSAVQMIDKNSKETVVCIFNDLPDKYSI